MIVCFFIVSVVSVGVVASDDLFGTIPGLDESVPGDDVIVETFYGALRGRRRPALPDAGGPAQFVDFFLGIPYAEPPVGPLRFKPPRVGVNWDGVRNATLLPPACPQAHRFRRQLSRQDEDCLYLNIYSPYHASYPEAKYPVLVYIHGGSYRVGSGTDYPGHVLAQQGVVVVTINYRLGVLGFLSSGTSDLPGNYGLMDQIASLVWLQQNLPAFIGDPSRVTIAGNSAGGSSVGLLAVSPAARGLFDRVIVQSGSPFSFWSMHNDTVDLLPYFNQLSSLFDCRGQSVNQTVGCLRQVDWQLIKDQNFVELPRVSPSRTDIRPRVDGDVIPAPLTELYSDGRLNPQAVMTGVVDHEWSRHILYLLQEELLPSNPHLDSQMNDGMERETFTEAVRHVVSNRFWWHESIAPVVIHEYTDWNQSRDPHENRHKYIELVSDMAMLAPTVKLAQLCSNRNVPVYLYHFIHQSRASNPTHQPWQSNFHQMELDYVFGCPFTGIDVDRGMRRDFTENDKNVSRLTMRLWSEFVKNGNPSFGDNQWLPYREETGHYFSIGNSGGASRQHLRADKVSFWNSLIPSLRASAENLYLTSELRHSVEWREFWAVVGVCILLAILLLISLVYITIKTKNGFRNRT